MVGRKSSDCSWQSFNRHNSSNKGVRHGCYSMLQSYTKHTAREGAWCAARRMSLSHSRRLFGQSMLDSSNLPTYD